MKKKLTNHMHTTFSYFKIIFAKIIITAILLSYPTQAFATNKLSQTIKTDDSTQTTSFTSEILRPNMSFTTVGATFMYKEPVGADIDVSVRFLAENWSPWVTVDTENDPFIENARYFTASSNVSTALQYRVELTPNNNNEIPLFENTMWTFLNANISLEKDVSYIYEEPKAEVAALFPTNRSKISKKSSSLNSRTINSSKTSTKVISRKSWGANESYRYGEADKDAVLVKVSEDKYEKYANELKRDHIETQNANGQKYKWPLEYPEKISKFIIHHTATTGNLDNPKQAIRDIYYYHTIVKGWGDIGYNYILDQDGKIYEGRAGGEMVIGAHAGFYNTGSIGISILGNFNNENPDPKVIKSLGMLVGEKAKKYKIDPSKYSKFRGQNLPNIVGHKDVMSTACPGSNLYDKLDAVRAIAKMVYDGDKKAYKLDYDFELANKDLYAEVKPSESAEYIVRVKNIGKKIWTSTTYLKLQNASDVKNVVRLSTSKSLKTKVQMNEKSVKKGGYATFTVKLNPQNSGLAIMDFVPVINGKKTISNHIYIPVNVLDPVLKYSIVSKKLPPVNMKKGTAFNGSIVVRNNGNTTWKQSGIGSVKLYVSGNGKSKFKSPSTKLISSLNEKEVKPGAVGTFELKLKSPKKAGYYSEKFVLKIDGKKTISGGSMSFGTSVGATGKSVSIDKVKFTKNMKRDEKYLIQVVVKNIGTSTLSKSKLKLDIGTDKTVEISKYYKIANDLKPGKSTILNAVLNIKKDTSLKDHIFVTKVLYDKKTISTKSEKVKFKVVQKNFVSSNTNETTQKKKVTSQIKNESVKKVMTTSMKAKKNYDSEHIRVKLGFEGVPKVTANTNFVMYRGDNYVRKFKANQIVEISEKNGIFYVKFDNQVYKKRESVRFKALKGGVMRIENFEHRPAWNINLNDNEYRGWLEITHDGYSDDLIVINDLELNDYLKGLGEVSNYENTEKIKAIIVAARSYAKYYMQDGHDKFAGKPYDLNDDPNISQRYLGYGLEKRSPKVANAVEATNGEVVTYKGKLVKAPYFSQSDGTVTKNAKDVWGWDNAPYLVSVDDSMCDATVFAGHGVGMSGCGAKALALSGKTYKEILEYYYTGIKIKIL